MHRFRLTDIHLSAVVRETCRLEQIVPVDAGIILQQLLPRHRVVVGLRVTRLHLVVADLGNPVLQGKGRLHLLLGNSRRIADHLQQVVVQAFVGGDHGFLLFVGMRIILRIQSDAALADADDVAAGVLGIHRHAEAHGEGPVAFHVEVVHQFEQLLAVLHGTYLRQYRLDGCVPLTVAACTVHVEVVERSDLLGNSALRLRLPRIVLHHLTDAFLVQFLQVDEGTVHGMFLVKRMGLHPVACCILIEILTGPDIEVHVVSVNARLQSLRHSSCRYERSCQK